MLSRARIFVLAVVVVFVLSWTAAGRAAVLPNGEEPVDPRDPPPVHDGVRSQPVPILPQE